MTSRQPPVSRMYFTTTETGALWGVSRATVQRLCRSGEVRSLRTPGGHWRIPADEVHRVLEEMENHGGTYGDAVQHHGDAAQPPDPKRAARGAGGDEATPEGMVG